MPRADSLQITPEMLSLIAEIDEFKGAWRGLARLAPERLVQLRKVATIESIGSSTRIEGARLTDREVEELLGRITTKSFATRDEQEVAGYADVMELIFSSHNAIPIRENHVKQLHSTLLQYSSKDERHRGEYKKFPNHVEAFDASGTSVGVVFHTSTPFDTPREMEELVAWFLKASEPGGLHPLIVIGIFVVVFLAIHPFQDGNGRLSRVLTTLLLLRSGYSYVPYASLESIIEQNKEAYYIALRRTQGTLKSSEPDWAPWLVFFLRAIANQKRALEAKVQRENTMRAALPDLAIRILEIISEHGQASVGDLVRATGAPRATIKKRIKDLLDAARIKRSGKGRATWYSLNAD